MMDEKGIFNFPPVDVQLKGAENYSAWAVTMLYNLRVFGVWWYVQGKVECPPDDIVDSSSVYTDDSTTPRFTSSGSKTSSDSLTWEKWSCTDD